MNLKIDTKEKFHEIHLLEDHLTANMTEDLGNLLSDLQNQVPANVVLCLEKVQQIDEEFSRQLVLWQGNSYENSHSLVICGLQPLVEKTLDETDVLELLNVTPTVSEAWDIVQMEEIERELLDGFDE
jgi:anti-anti-sigma regulatory factor